MNDKITALLSEVRGILEQHGDSDVAKKIAEYLPELPGFEVVHRYRVKFKARQLGLAGEPAAVKAALKAINKGLASMMNAGKTADFITQQMRVIIDGHRQMLAGGGASATKVVESALAIYSRDQGA